MIKTSRLLLSITLLILLASRSMAEAPVVDDSENFALLDKHQAAFEQQPVGSNGSSDENEGALAHDEANLTDATQLLKKIQNLQQGLQELRGQLETQAQSLKSLQQQQLEFYKDLDGRLRNNNLVKTNPAEKNSVTPSKPSELTLQAPTQNPATASAAATTPTTLAVVKPSVSAKNLPDEQISYLAAYDLIKNRQFDQALSAMQNFVSRYPQGGYTGNAHYWLGELYMVKNNYPEAITQFEAVLQQFPASSKVAASMLKKGYALAASGQAMEAQHCLQQVIKTYPDTPTAQLATAKLASLGSSAM